MINARPKVETGIILRTIASEFLAATATAIAITVETISVTALHIETTALPHLPRDWEIAPIGERPPQAADPTWAI